MIKINIVAVGKLKEKYLQDASLEYAKRIRRYFNLEIIEVPDYSDKINEERLLAREGEGIIQKLKGKIILLDLSGDNLSSEEFEEYISNEATRGFSEHTFIIGGSRGVSDEIKEMANKKISFGKMTMPHQLVRIVLLEQIYRIGTIMKNESYHK